MDMCRQPCKAVDPDMSRISECSAQGDACPLIDVEKLQNMVAQSREAKKNEEI